MMGAGGHIGPNCRSRLSRKIWLESRQQVRHGGGAMPPFAGVLSDQEITMVAHYVVEQIAPKG